MAINVSVNLPISALVKWLIFTPIVFLTLCLLGANSYSQNLTTEQISIENGLSHNSVYDIVQDHNGFVWLATQNGLNRYNGHNIEIIAQGQQNKLSEEFKGKCITSIFLDSNKNLWAGTRMGHINIKYHNSNSFCQLEDTLLETLLQDHEIARFYQDANNNIWIASVGSGIFKYNLTNKSFKSFTVENSNLSSNEVFDIIDYKNSVLVACGGGSLNILKGDNTFYQSHETRANSPNLSGFRKRLLKANGSIWLATEGTGLYRIDPKSLNFINYNEQISTYGFEANVVRDLLIKNDSTLLIATDGHGLYELNTHKNEFSKIVKDVNGRELFNSKAMYCLATDKQKQLWIGTYNGGANILLNQRSFLNLKAPKNNSKLVSDKSILAIGALNNNELLIGTDGSGLYNFNIDSSHFSKIDFIRQSNIQFPEVVKVIFNDGANRFLLGCYSKGLYSYNASNNQIEHLHDNLNVWAIKKGPNGNYWLGTLGYGLVVLDSNLNWMNQEIFPRDISVNVMDIEFDTDNNLWIGTGNEGLYKYNLSNKVLTKYTEGNSSFLSNEIRTLKALPNSKMIIGTEGAGLSIYENGDELVTLTIENGLLSNDVIGVQAVGNNEIWVSSFNGISKVDLVDFSVENHSLNGVSKSNQLNQNTLFANNDMLFIGGIYGLSTLDLLKAAKPKFSSKTVICGIDILEKPIYKLKNNLPAIENIKELVLNHDENNIMISFFTPEYFESSARVYNYQLIGFDNKTKRTAQGRNSVSYTNLDPGSYQFNVGINDTFTTLKIKIELPFWQQLWFRFSLSIVIICFIVGVIYFFIRRNKLKLNEQMMKLKNEKLALELEGKNAKLMFSTVQMAHKNEFISEIKTDIINSQYEEKPQTPKLIRKLDRELLNEDYWHEFEIYFNQVDKHFVKSFKEQHASLTQNDIRICSLIRLNLSTKEIASLLNVSTRAIEQSKYRLKKRLGLTKEQNLVEYIENFSI